MKRAVGQGSPVLNKPYGFWTLNTMFTYLLAELS